MSAAPRATPRRASRVALALASCAALALADGAGPPARQDTPPDSPTAAAPSPATTGEDAHAARDAAAWAAVERGLAWLAAEQERGTDGSWPPGRATFQAPVAVAALSTLAFLAGGSGVERGPHGAAVARAVDYLVGRVDTDARSPKLGYVASPGDPTSNMHGHGYATHALAEAFAVSPATARGRDLARVLPLALRLIERTQGADGAWWYFPRVSVDHEGSVTITLVQAMRAAAGAGLEVDARVIAAAEDYVRRSQTEEGAFAYRIGDSRKTVALTAAAIATLNATGTYDDPAIRRGIDWIQRELARRDTRDGSEFPFYERLYLAQALWQLSDRGHFDAWFDDEVRHLLATQSPDGRWTDPRYGDAYATAMNCLVLAMPAGLLPSFAR